MTPLTTENFLSRFKKFAKKQKGEFVPGSIDGCALGQFVASEGWEGRSHSCRRTRDDGFLDEIYYPPDLYLAAVYNSGGRWAVLNELLATERFSS